MANNEELSLELKTLKKVVERLDEAKIDYMLTGSMALNFYGHPRATNDFDIVLAVGESDITRIIDLFESDFYLNRDTIKKAIKEKTLFNIIDNDSVFKVDFIVHKNDPYSVEQFKRRRIRIIAGIKTAVISLEDLILAKLSWSQESGSEMQERDIQQMLRLYHSDLDRKYLEQWATFLGVQNRLKDIDD